MIAEVQTQGQDDGNISSLKTKIVIQYNLAQLLHDLEENQFLLEPVWNNYAEVANCSQGNGCIKDYLDRIKFFLHQYQENVEQITNTLGTVLEDIDSLEDPSQIDK